MGFSIANAGAAHIGCTGGPNGGTSGQINTTGADFIAMWVGGFNFGSAPITFTVKDGLGSIGGSSLNTWHALTQYSYTPDHDQISGQWFYATKNDGGFTVGSNHEFQVTSSGHYVSFEVTAYTGSLTSATPFEGTDVGAAAVVFNQLASGSFTPGTANCLILGGSVSNNSSQGAATSTTTTVTKTDDVAAGGGNNIGTAMCWGVQSGTVADNINFDPNNGVFSEVVAAAVFKPGPTGPNPNLTVQNATGGVGALTVTLSLSESLTVQNAAGGVGALTVFSGQVIQLASVNATGGVGALSETLQVNTVLAAVNATGGVGTLIIPIFAINEFTTRQGFGNDDSQAYATITFSGTYSGSGYVPAGLQVKLDYNGGGAFQAATTLSNFTASGGVWSGKLQVPLGSFLLATAKDPTYNVLSNQQTHYWAVGYRTDFIGQSNSNRMNSAIVGRPAGVPDSHNTLAAWAVINITAITDGVGGCMGASAVCNMWRTWLVGQNASDTTCWIEVQAASGGTPVSPNWQSGGADWNNYVTNANAAQPNGARTAFWMQGEANATASPGSAGYAGFLAATVALTASLQARADFLFGVVQISSLQDSGSYTAVDCNAVRLAHWNQGHQPGCFYGGSTWDCSGGNTDMQDNAAGAGTYDRIGRRFVVAELHARGLIGFGADGPRITRAYRPKTALNTVNCVVTQSSGGTQLLDGSGSSAGTSLNNFVVNVNGTPATISATAFVQPNLIALTLSAPTLATDTVNVLYADGTGGFPSGTSNYAGDLAHFVYDNNGAGQGGPLSGNVATPVAGKLNDTLGFPLMSTMGVAVPAPVGGQGETRYFALRHGRR
jgi:hypothetical protein